MNESGYRYYSPNAIKTIAFIKHAQELGFRLDEIKDLLNLRVSSVNRCESVRKKAKTKLTDIQEKIRMLQGISKTLNELIRDCENNKTSKGCPIINSLEVSA